jgi:exodeoxyribonuclease V alpha subunit
MKGLAEPLAEFLTRLNGDASPALTDAVRLLCNAVSEGHVCLPLHEMEPGMEETLRASRVVGGPGDFRPLIIEHGNFYLTRYHQYEARLAAQLRERASHVDAEPGRLVTLRLAQMTGDPSQQQAVVAALRRRLCIITGGPGTGKTRTAAVALTLLREHLGEKRLRIALAAPTGKAAARLSSSLADILGQLDLQPAVRKDLQVPAVTLHRLLGAMPGESQFRYRADHPLPLDVLVVDEASMIDLPMMAKLLDALHREAKLVLLGDRDQLASVEAGHVLGDICAATSESLRECVTELTTNHRFSGESGIHRLAGLVKAGNTSETMRLLRSAAPDLVAHKLPERLVDGLKPPLIDGWRDVIEAQNAAEALDRMGDFRILCALREGPQGVTHLNRAAEHVLATAGLIAPTGTHYAGRPILILRNDYQLKLFNGDLGVLRHDDRGELRAYFSGEDGTPRSFSPARLPEHDTAFAMTVHKAQGSEFKKVLVVLPAMDQPVVSRELIYTAVTRARLKVELWWSESSLRAALQRRVIRWSGLRERFQGERIATSRNG